MVSIMPINFNDFYHQIVNGFFAFGSACSTGYASHFVPIHFLSFQELIFWNKIIYRKRKNVQRRFLLHLKIFYKYSLHIVRSQKSDKTFFRILFCNENIIKQSTKIDFCAFCTLICVYSSLADGCNNEPISKNQKIYQESSYTKKH